MHSMDTHLAAEGLTPFQRPLHVPRLLWDAFRWEGNIFPPKELANLPGFDGQVLMAKAYRWYELVYGEKLKSDWTIGFAPFKLGSALWRVRFPVIYGQCHFFIDRNLTNSGVSLSSRNQPATYNLLCSVEELPQGLADRLEDSRLEEFWSFYISTFKALAWRQEYLKGSSLFTEAVHDYAESVDNLLSRRFAQSRWASSQAIEKTLKGILDRTNIPYPTGGAKGHDLLQLSDLLKDAHGISLNPSIVSLAQCSPAVRYGEEPTSEEQALNASHTVISVIEMLSKSPQTALLLSPKHLSDPLEST